jgi:hypothetical protein
LAKIDLHTVLSLLLKFRKDIEDLIQLEYFRSFLNVYGVISGLRRSLLILCQILKAEANVQITALH